MKHKYSSLLGVFFMLAAGCSVVERQGVNAGAPLLKDLVDKVMTLESASLAEEGLPGQLLLISALVEFSPKNDQLLAVACQGYTSYGLIVELEDPGYADELYGLAQDYGLRALRYRNVAVDEGLTEGKHLVDLNKELTKGDVFQAFWYAMASGLKTMLNLSDPYALTALGDVNSVMDRIVELDETFFYYSPHLFRAAYYALSGPMLGGGPEKAQKEFGYVFEKTQNKFLLAHAFYAQFYAAGIIDETLFDKTINYILSTPSDVLPKARLANEIAKKKALWLKAHKDRFF
jgi:hypothetical protein